MYQNGAGPGNTVDRDSRRHRPRRRGRRPRDPAPRGRALLRPRSAPTGDRRADRLLGLQDQPDPGPRPRSRRRANLSRAAGRRAACRCAACFASGSVSRSRSRPVAKPIRGPPPGCAAWRPPTRSPGMLPASGAIGLAGGFTMDSLASALPKLRHPGLIVVPVVGGWDSQQPLPRRERAGPSRGRPPRGEGPLPPRARHARQRRHEGRPARGQRRRGDDSPLGEPVHGAPRGQRRPDHPSRIRDGHGSPRRAVSAAAP